MIFRVTVLATHGPALWLAIALSLAVIGCSRNEPDKTPSSSAVSTATASVSAVSTGKAKAPRAWTSQQVVKDIKGRASLVIAKDGTRAISFTGDQEIRVVIAKPDARGHISQWPSSVEVTATGRDPVLAIDPTNRAHVAYFQDECADPGCPATLQYWTMADGKPAGEPELVQDQADLGGELRIAVDGRGRVHLAYLDRKTRDLKYALRDAQGWRVTVAAAGGDESKRRTLPTAMALDSGGHPHLVYTGHDGAERRQVGPLHYLRQVEGQWKTEAVPEVTRAFRAALILTDDQPQIVYCAEWNRPHVKLATRSAAGWTHEVIVDGSDRSVPPCRTHLMAARGPAGPLHVVYGSGGTIHHWVPDGDGWKSERVDTGAGPSLAVDVAGKPFIAYRTPQLGPRTLLYGLRKVP